MSWRSGREILYIVSLLVVLLLSACREKVSPEKHEGQILDSIREVGKLDLVEVSTEEIFVISGSGHTLYSVRTLEEVSEYLADLLRVGSRKGVYSFTNYSVAYMNLSELTVEDVTFEGGTAKLVLPRVQVEPIGRSGTLRKLHERVSGNKSPISNKERTEMQNRASALAKKRLVPGSSAYESVVREAEEKAISFFTGFLHSRGYERVEVVVEKSGE